MNKYSALAIKTIKKFILHNEILKLENTDKELSNQKAGVFVSIYNKKELRGCIGTFLPTKENLLNEIISSAVNACQDARFSPIQKQEIPNLSCEVYILQKPILINNTRELNPKKYGVLVQGKNKSGILLPDLEGIDTIEQQMSIVIQKAGINLEKEKISIFKFEAKKYVSD